ncbi:hypothetical protein [Pedobacter hartonius]|uniref:Uncharacterized protein n=1 Tax=Pedobacter hartonius TaxID=425514 RepID=A0A1H3XK00_9SPHI|nr:hypothetical protein [Pedobacter hartonius]SDZ99676.1 hypothetical protein SAMN05443550_101642 [Pedobacter hartonius]
MEKLKLELIIERGENDLTGRVTYNNNLIIENAQDVHSLSEKLKVLLFDFEELDPDRIEFEYYYDIFSLFQEFNFLNIGKVAKRAGINAGLLRQYASQVKYPSAKQAKKIEETIHQLGHDMSKVLIHAK